MPDQFKNEVFSSFEFNPVRACSYCCEKPALVQIILDSRKGRTVQMFKCQCGEQTWLEDND